MGRFSLSAGFLPQNPLLASLNWTGSDAQIVSYWVTTRLPSNVTAGIPALLIDTFEFEEWPQPSRRRRARRRTPYRNSGAPCS